MIRRPRRSPLFPYTPLSRSRAREGLDRLRQPRPRARPAPAPLALAPAEAVSLHAVSALVVTAALARPESRGCHRWRDAPLATPGGRVRHTVLRADPGQRASGAVHAGAGAGV